MKVKNSRPGRYASARLPQFRPNHPLFDPSGVEKLSDGLMRQFPQRDLIPMKPREPLRISPAMAFLAVLPVLSVLALCASATAAETRLKVKYGVSLSGFPVASAYLNYVLDGKGYTVTGSARTIGIVRLISNGRGKVSATGRRHGSHLVPAAFSYDITDDGDRETLKMAFIGNRVGKIEIDPPENPKKLKRRVPLKRSHKVGVLDPLSALFIPAGADKVCDRTLSIFDGGQRYDLVLTRKRTDRFRGGGKNFKGRVVVCAISYRPIAGHRANKREVKYMQRNSSMEIWMAPIGDTGIMAPVIARLNTQIGKLVIRAKRYQLQ